MTLVLEVTIPTLPPSVNKVYVPVTVRQKGHKAFNTIRMGRDATDWKSQATLFLPPVRLSDRLYKIVIEVHTDWYQKDGITPKRRDVDNFVKLVTDTVFQRYHQDDKWVFDSRIIKVQNIEKEKVVVRLYGIE